MRPLIQDLDELPFMATDFLEELQLKHGKNVTAYLVSSRGCYKNCSFYSIAAYFDMFEGCRMRYRSVKSVFEEIKYLYQKQCTCCLETLVKLHLDNKGKDYIEFEYQKSVQRFNRFLDEVMNMNVWKYIDKYNNIFMQENL